MNNQPDDATKKSKLLDAPLSASRYKHGKEQRNSNYHNHNRRDRSQNRRNGNHNNNNRHDRRHHPYKSYGVDHHKSLIFKNKPPVPPVFRSIDQPLAKIVVAKNKPPVYRIIDQPLDRNLPQTIPPDPRGSDPAKRLTMKATNRGNGRNTESFDPASTLVRPDLRVKVASSSLTTYQCPLKHDDVLIVPELFGKEDDWSLYYKLVEEITELQKGTDDKSNGRDNSDWIPWHEGAHLITKKPDASPTFQKIIDRLCEYFRIQKKSIGTRFNWYRDSSDWKPFHHDSAAFNPQRAENQNITVGVSFGATRELAFIRAIPYENGEKCRLYFPQVNNGVFSFGRDANILWKHGINALPAEQQDGKGRISIILWGLAEGVIEEEGSPPLLGSDGQGPHAHRPSDNGRRRHHELKRKVNDRENNQGNKKKYENGNGGIEGKDGNEAVEMEGDHKGEDDGNEKNK